MPYAVLRSRVARTVCLLTLVLATAESSAQTARPISPLSVSPLYRSGSVWQRDVANVLRGEAGANERVSFESEELGSASAKTDGAGKWSIALAAHRAGGPYAARLTAGGDTVRLDSIYVGDVFVCSGQSNMEWEVINATGGERDAANDRDDRLRHFKVPKLLAPAPVDILSRGAVWDATAPGSTEYFTAVGYYFARALRQRNPDVPIGVVNANWGGSTIEAWLPTAPNNRSVVPGSGDGRRANWARLRDRFPEAFTPAGDEVSAAELAPPFDSLPVGVPWEYTGMPDVDGQVWYRTSVRLSEAEARGPVTLALGPIDDSDSTYVNGVFAGGLQGAPRTNRYYRLPSATLRAGDNVVSVRVEDTGGNAGLTGPPDSIYLATATRKLPLGDRPWAARPQRIRIDSLGASPQRPTMLYNGMIAPLRGLRARGVLWYQGESNAGNTVQADRYAAQLSVLTAVFRAELGDASLPMLVVELPEFTAPSGGAYAAEDAWPVIRSAQQAALNQDSNYAAIVTLGLGEADDIHPRNKLSVGERAADAAQRLVYGELDGPVYARPLKLTEGGGDITIQFSGVGAGLKVKEGQSVSGFAIQDDAGRWTAAGAQLVASDRIRIVSAPGHTITRVAYAWANNPTEANLVNSYDLPVSSFRLAVTE